jgi:hypothetical protein
MAGRYFSIAVERIAVVSINAPRLAIQVVTESSSAGGTRTAPSTKERSTAGPKESRPVKKRVSVLARPVTRLMVLSTHPYGSCSSDANLRPVNLSPARSSVAANVYGVK